MAGGHAHYVRVRVHEGISLRRTSGNCWGSRPMPPGAVKIGHHFMLCHTCAQTAHTCGHTHTWGMCTSTHKHAFCTHTHKHTHTHIHARTYTHAMPHMRMHTRTCLHARTYIHALPDMCTDIQKHIRTCEGIHLRLCDGRATHAVCVHAPCKPSVPMRRQRNLWQARQANPCVQMPRVFHEDPGTPARSAAGGEADNPHAHEELNTPTQYVEHRAFGGLSRACTQKGVGGQ